MFFLLIMLSYLLDESLLAYYLLRKINFKVFSLFNQLVSFINLVSLQLHRRLSLKFEFEASLHFPASRLSVENHFLFHEVDKGKARNSFFTNY